MSGKSKDIMISLLSEHVKIKTWQKCDINRAHRLGTKRDDATRPRPLIAKFQESIDKVHTLKARPSFKEAGVNIASDLTETTPTPEGTGRNGYARLLQARKTG